MATLAIKGNFSSSKSLFPNLKERTLNLLAIPMRIMSDAKWIERAHSGLANFLVGLLCVCLPRNKILLPYPWSKQSMLQPVVVHNYFGYDKL
jgi:hypothetical protein